MTQQATPELEPAVLADRLTSTAGRLCDVIETEVGLLNAFRLAEVEALQAEKRDLAQDYGALMGQLEARPETAAAIDNTRRSALRAAAKRLAQATEANALALRAGLDANARLMTSIANAVREAQDGAGNYRADGRSAEAAANKAPRPVSINEVL